MLCVHACVCTANWTRLTQGNMTELERCISIHLHMNMYILMDALACKEHLLHILLWHGMYMPLSDACWWLLLLRLTPEKQNQSFQTFPCHKWHWWSTYIFKNSSHQFSLEETTMRGFLCEDQVLNLVLMKNLQRNFHPFWMDHQVSCKNSINLHKYVKQGLN